MKKRDDQKRIVINIHQSEPLDVSWAIMDDLDTITTVIHGDLTALAEKVTHYPVHVIIPGQDVLLLQAELPQLSRERARQAIPHALEDKLIDEIEYLHFAIPDERTQGATSVAIISKKKIEMYLHLLQSYGIKPHTIVPTMLVLPCIKNQWFVSCYSEMVYVRTQPFEGFACDISNLFVFLQDQLSKITEKPECIHIEKSSTTVFDFHFDAVTINNTVLNEASWLERTAILLDENPHINLLQGNYHSNVTSVKSKKIWAWTGILAIAWIIVLFVSQLSIFFILSHSKKLSEREISALYYQQFPTATSVIAPRERMESALRKISNDKNNFLLFMGIWGNSLSKITDIHIISFIYQENQLNVVVLAKSFDILDIFIQDLNKQGLKAKQQNATTMGTEVKATIFIVKK